MFSVDISGGGGGCVSFFALFFFLKSLFFSHTSFANKTHVGATFSSELSVSQVSFFIEEVQGMFFQNKNPKPRKKLRRKNQQNRNEKDRKEPKKTTEKLKNSFLLSFNPKLCTIISHNNFLLFFLNTFLLHLSFFFFKGGGDFTSFYTANNKHKRMK